VVALASISPDPRNETIALRSSRKSRVFGAVLFVVATAAVAQEAPTDAQIRDAIIKESIASIWCKRRSKNPSLKRPVGPVAPE
jgi:hypothetical protein